MIDDNKGGSGSGTGDANLPPDPKNKTVKMSMDQALAYIGELEEKNRKLEALKDELTMQLGEANDVLEAQEKARLINEIMPRSTFKMDELVGKSIEDLKNIRATLDQAVLPKVNSVRFGVQAADLSDREKGLTVGDLSWVTAQKRKAQTGVA